MRRLTLTQHTVRCPLEDCTASLTVRSASGGNPSRRFRDVAACSLQPPTSFVLPATRGYFADMAPAVWYLAALSPAPHHTSKVSCSKPCLAILNAAEVGAAEPVQCTSGVCDALELARQTQSLAMMRVLWSHSG